MITHCERLESWMKFLSVLLSLLPKLEKIPEVVERCQYLEDAGIDVIAPELQGNELLWQTIDSMEGNYPVLVYPLFKEDANLGEITAYYVRDRANGSGYACGSNTILINMFHETHRFLAGEFLHELGHAFRAFKEQRVDKRASRTLEERLSEEVDMWTVDYKIMLALGGSNYQKAAKSMAFEINRCWKGKCSDPTRHGMGSALKYCFGPPLRGESTFKRDTLYATLCALMAADYYLPSAEAKTMKRQIVGKDYLPAYTREDRVLRILLERR